MKNDKTIITIETIKVMEDMTFFTHAKIFDDLLIVLQKESNCFVLKTSKGLVMIDAIWPSIKVYNVIVNAILDVGWNPNEIKKLILTHGYIDHNGYGSFFVKKHNVQTYLLKIDDIFWTENPTKPDRPETWKECFFVK